MRISDWSSDVCSSDLTDYLATAACNTEGTGTDSRRTVYCNGADIGTVLTTTDASDSDTLFNWKLGVLYKPVEAASIYANYTLSQKPPGGANFQLTNAEGRDRKSVGEGKSVTVRKATGGCRITKKKT